MVRCSDLPVEDLTITRKILTHEKNLVELGLGKPGERVSYWYKRLARYHSKTGKPLKPYPNAKRATKAVETNSGEYWSDDYVTELDEVYRSILGIEELKPSIVDKSQLKLDLGIFTERRAGSSPL